MIIYTEPMITALSLRRRRALALLGWLAAMFAMLAGPARAAAPQPAPLPSLLLVASDRIDDPRFRQSVVLVIRHGGAHSGAIGVIINRPLRLPLRQLFPDIPEPAEFPSLHYGGPVSPENLVYLFRTGQAVPPEVLQVHPRVYLAQSPRLLGRLLHRELPAERVQVFSGHAGWAPGQLENEIQRGDWLLLPVSDAELFPAAPGSLWKELHRRATLRNTGGPPPRDDPRPAGVLTLPHPSTSAPS